MGTGEGGGDMDIGEGMCYDECCEMCKPGESQTCTPGDKNICLLKFFLKKDLMKIIVLRGFLLLEYRSVTCYIFFTRGS